MEKNGELYCLKWNQFQINIFSALESLHLSEEFADVTLYCDGTSHKAHKVILSACSPYFKSVFMEHPHCTHPVIILKGVSCEDLNSLLTFMYQGEVNIQRERLPEFMRTAKLLQVRGLTNCYEITPVSTKSSPNQKQHKRSSHGDDSNTDSDSSSHGKKRVRIRRKSSTKSSQESTGDLSETLIASNLNVTETNDNNDKPSALPVSDNNNKENVNDKLDSKENLHSDNAPIKIKQEVIDQFESQSVSSDYDTEGSILQRSLIGDHTVKPAESLVVTPDLPLSMNSLSTPIKVEPEEPKSTINNLPKPTQTPPIYTKTTKKFPDIPTYSKDKTQHITTDSNDNFEDKLSNTLQLLKSNPQISISREHLENINKKEHKPGGSKQKSSQYEIQPQISIEPMKHPTDENIEKLRIYPPPSNNTPSILAQNLTKIVAPPSKSYQITPRNLTVTQTVTKMAVTETNTQPLESQSSLSTLVQLFGQAAHATGNSQQSGGQSWNCPHCQQLYHNQSALKYHVRLVHSDFNNRLCCYLCPNSFTMRESYKAHMLELHGIRH